VRILQTIFIDSTFEKIFTGAYNLGKCSLSGVIISLGSSEILLLSHAGEKQPHL